MFDWLSDQPEIHENSKFYWDSTNAMYCFSSYFLIYFFKINLV